MEQAVCGALAVFFAWYILRPGRLSNGESDHHDAVGARVTMEQKERLINMLRDLELDFSTGKLTEAEYTRMRHAISHDLSEIMLKTERKNS